MAQPVKAAKIVLMGRAAAGKTSMKSIVFANPRSVRETNRLHPTNFIDHVSLKFLRDLPIDLWDCGGCDSFMEMYFETYREMVFGNVDVLIYVFPVHNRVNGTFANTKDLTYFQHAMDSLCEFSPGARVFCLIHKMDLVRVNERDEVFRIYERDLKKAVPRNIHCIGTSIYNETVFTAWSEIVKVLVPDSDQLNQHLDHICHACGVDEVVLFEKDTFLPIGHSSTRIFEDAGCFERISNLVKRFRRGCGKVKTNFQSLQVKTSLFSATIEPFLDHTFVMVVSGPQGRMAATAANLMVARGHFAELARQGVSLGAHL